MRSTSLITAAAMAVAALLPASQQARAESSTIGAWGLHPHDIITDSFPLDRVADASALMAGGRSGKVVVEVPG